MSIQKLPSLDQIKTQAKRLRSKLETVGQAVSHSQSLELLAHQLGHRDWNTLHAAVGNQPPACPVELGAHVVGAYLGQPFMGEVMGVKVVAEGRYRITLNFDEAVDVVKFDSFSAFRKRVSCIVDSTGCTLETTSDGVPHMALELN